jgi:HAE1 family hydrophobic/amphiphilic exporter-1
MTKVRKDFNYYIVEYFLKNKRLAILLFGFILILALLSIVNLKTTGFPSPSLGIITVRAIYPGAAPEVVRSQVTTVLESAIKQVDGIESYTATSAPSISILSLTLKPGVDQDQAITKIESAVKSVGLPADVAAPIVNKINISGTDLQLAVVGKSWEEKYNTASKIKQDLANVTNFLSVSEQVPLLKKVMVNLDTAEAERRGISPQAVKAAVGTLGEVVPVISDVALNGNQVSLQTSTGSNTLEDLKKLKINTQTPFGPVSVDLSAIASIEVKYDYENGVPSQVAWNNGDSGINSDAVVLRIKATPGSDLAKFTADVEQVVKNISGVTYVADVSNFPDNVDSTYILKNYASNDENQAQVDEVISGLIGGQLDGISDETLSNIGWLLGGIQLVFLAMLLLVSFRAAIIAALSIPLSLIFSTIYLFLIGEQLNTLVLFSLVLVIGLVVDPTLVILESVQRKIDSGLKGREAILASVGDVGIGLFLACLTNIIVFAPFGLISGVIGQIFSYIPLTVIPATVGSYVVPLIFLSVIGGYFLKRSKKSTGSEIDNLWPIAKYLIKLNSAILNSKFYVRYALILLFISLPLVISGMYFGSGQIKIVQFATTENVSTLNASISFNSNVSRTDQIAIKNKILSEFAANPNVEQIYSLVGQDLNIDLKSKTELGTKPADLADYLQAKGLELGGDKVYDLLVAPQNIGAAGGDYNIALSVKEADPARLKQGSLYLAKLLGAVCYQNDGFKIDFSCPESDRAIIKINDGYTNLGNTILDVALDPTKLQANNLKLESGPVSILVNSQIRQQFTLVGANPDGSVKIGNQDTDVFVETTAADPSTQDALRNLELRNLRGNSIALNSVATITEQQVANSITTVNGQVQGVVQARLAPKYAQSQVFAAQVTDAVQEYIQNDASTEFTKLEIPASQFGEFSQGASASFARSFSDLLTTLLLAIVITYIVLALFFNSLLQPFVVLLTIPLTFIGIFPALTAFAGGQFGFLEIIGLIILVGIVENVAIFLLDAAKQLRDTGMSKKEAIASASGLRFRSVLLTNVTAIASLAPLAVFSEFYRSIAVVIIFGLITSGIASLITTPLVWMEFDRVSGFIKRKFRAIVKFS